MDIQVAPLIQVLRDEIDFAVTRLVQRSATSGRRQPGRDNSRRLKEERDDDSAALRALCASIDALLEDAVVEPLPAMPKVHTPSGNSKKTRKRKRKKKAHVFAR